MAGWLAGRVAGWPGGWAARAPPPPSSPLTGTRPMIIPKHLCPPFPLCSACPSALFLLPPFKLLFLIALSKDQFPNFPS